MIPRRALLTGLALALTGPAFAQSSTGLSNEDEALVQKAQAYLDGLTTATGRFVQIAQDGRESTGTVWLQRPGRARFDYDPPSGVQIAADGRVVTEVDTRLKTIHSYPLGTTPLSLFLSKHIALDQGARVQAVRRTDDGFEVEVRDGQRRRGSIALQFRNNPLALTGWVVTDSRRAKVQVRLTHLERSAPKPGVFFFLRAPPPEGLLPADRASPR
ncbi:MAG: outer membrane lipoprotein carrier protein LolA [Caulobacteraceae bacterium]|nr:outer membrane lipoprotein carrier protein LolA [Caulobacteraceae bacterium]